MTTMTPTIMPATEAEFAALVRRQRQELDQMHQARIAALEAEKDAIERELRLLRGESLAALAETVAAVLAEDERTMRPYVRPVKAHEVPPLLGHALEAAAWNCPPDRAPVVLLALHRPLTPHQPGRHDATTGGAVERVIAVVDVEQARAAQRVRQRGPVGG